MTDRQKRNLMKLAQDIPTNASQRYIEEATENAIAGIAHYTRILYEDLMKEGFSDEQAMFLTSSITEAMMLGGAE